MCDDDDEDFEVPDDYWDWLSRMLGVPADELERDFWEGPYRAAADGSLLGIDHWIGSATFQDRRKSMWVRFRRRILTVLCFVPLMAYIIAGVTGGGKPWWHYLVNLGLISFGFGAIGLALYGAYRLTEWD